MTDETPTIFCTPIIKNSVAYFKEIDIQEIRNQNLDFILQLGFDFVAGEVINTTKYGIWRFNQGDSFWTFLKGDFYNIISLQRLSGSEDKEIFLKKVVGKFCLRYNKFIEEGFLLIREDYKKRAEFLNMPVTVRVFEKDVSGTVVDVTDKGALKLVDENNKEHVLLIGDIL